MEEFLNQFLDFVDKGTDWKENNETTNSQVISRFIANNDKLVTELVDTLCEGKESSDELGDCNMPRVTNRTLSKNRGMVIFSREILTNDPTEEELKVIFSNFFPIAIENDHSYNLYQNLKMYGYSQHFREVEEGEVCPKYEMFFRRDENGVHFDKMVEQLP